MNLSNHIIQVPSFKRKVEGLTLTNNDSLKKKRRSALYLKKKRRHSLDISFKGNGAMSKVKVVNLRSFSEPKRRKTRFRLETTTYRIDPQFKIVKDFVKQTQLYIQNLYKDYKRKYQLKNSHYYANSYEQGISDDDHLMDFDYDVLNVKVKEYNDINKAQCTASSIEINGSNDAVYYKNKVSTSFGYLTQEKIINNFSVISSKNCSMNKSRGYTTVTSSTEITPDPDFLLKMKKSMEEKVSYYNQRKNTLQQAINEKDEEISQMTLEYENTASLIATLQREAQLGTNNNANMNKYIKELRNNFEAYCRIKAHCDSKQKCICYPEVIDAETHKNKMIQQAIELKNKETNTSSHYNFDRIFQEDEDQSMLFNCLKGSLSKALEGEGVSLLVIGQSNSGKSYTLKGDDRNRIDTDDCNTKTNKNDGIIQRFYELSIQEAQRKSFEIKISFSIMVLVNDTVYEVYLENKGDQHLKSNIIQKAPFQIEKWLILPSKDYLNTLLNYADAIHLFQEGKKDQSHLLYQFKIEHTNKRYRDAYASFIKTSGSESLLYSKDNPHYHNTKSIKALGQVISMLIDKKSNKAQIPYKETKLTQLLRNPFKTSSKIIAIMTISPEEKNYEHTSELMKFSVKSKMAY